MQPESAKTGVFISYSRRDSAFAERLREKLEASGHDAYVDKHDIAPGEDWRSRLGGLIEAADTVVFVVSPDSVDSDVCDWEVNRAERLGKRILPVVCRDPPEYTVPDRLQRLNYIFMRTPEEEAEGLAKLVDAIAVDITWVRAHTRYGERAGDWDRASRPARLLLRGSDIERAEAWRDGRPATAPAPSQLQLVYIADSRKAAGRRLRLWLRGRDGGPRRRRVPPAPGRRRAASGRRAEPRRDAEDARNLRLPPGLRPPRQRRDERQRHRLPRAGRAGGR
jgi:hypothetical protein